MDWAGAVIRSQKDVKAAITATKDALDSLVENTILESTLELPDAFANYDLLLCQYVYLSAIDDYIEHGGQSRGLQVVHEHSHRIGRLLP